MGQSRTGTKKLATKQEVDKTQYCIEEVLVEETLKELPKKGIKIIGAGIEINHYSMRKRKPIPNRLKRLGVTVISQREVDMRCYLTFDETTPQTIMRNTRLACNALGADYNRASFNYITLANGTGAGKFERTKKDITPDDNDRRRKTAVLGLTDAQGDVKSLIASVSAGAYSCHIETVPVRVVTCARSKR